MERVIKDESDQQNTGSLVFRIKRASPINDDSGIRCSSPSSDEMSTEEQTEKSRSPIRLRIPKALFDTANNDIKLHRTESCVSESLATTNNISDPDALEEDITSKSVETANVDTKNDVSNVSNYDKNLENVETELSLAGMKNIDSDILNDDRILKNVETETASAGVTNLISETALNIRKRRRRTLKFDVPIELRRRSRRIVHRQLQNEYQQGMLALIL